VSDSVFPVALASEVGLGMAREAALVGKMRANGTSPADGKVAKAAQEFEAILLNQWLQQAQEAFAGVPGGSDDEDSDPGHSQLQEIGMQSLATAITKSGGIGIAALLIRQLERQNSADGVAEGPPAPARLRELMAFTRSLHLTKKYCRND
jgi:peptidoglycan hydrolase FlgJ